MTSYVLGIDGGGSGTRAMIMDIQGALCGLGESGPSNYQDVGAAVAQANIQQAVTVARQTAGVLPEPFAATFLGLAGIGSAPDRAVIHQIARGLDLAPEDKIGVDHDIRIALAGGLSGRPGIVLIAGTGSSCYGRNAAGEHWRSGGWGPLISDEGSGYWLGVQAIRSTVRAFDGRTGPTALLPVVQEQLELADINEMLHRLYVQGMTRAEIAQLAPLVLQTARAGDAIALDLLRTGAAEMAETVLAVARHLNFAERPCELALAGGLFQAGDVVIEPLQAAVTRRMPHCSVALAECPPVVGACLLALELLQVTLHEATLTELRRAAQKL